MPGPRTQLLLLLALSAALRLAGNTLQGVWYDEAALITYAQLDWDQLLQHAARGGGPLVGLSKSPLVVLALRGWMGLFGAGELALRLPFALVGVATVALQYLLLRRPLGHGVALGAAALLALHPLHVYYSQQVSEYGPLVLGTVGSMLLWLGQPGSGRLRGARAAGLVAVNLLLPLIHPMGLAVCLIQLLLDLVSGRRQAGWLNLPGLGLGALVLLRGADPSLLEASLSWIPPLTPARALDAARLLIHGVAGHGDLAREHLGLQQTAALVLVPLLAVLGARAAAQSPGGRRWTAPFLLTWTLLPAVGLAAFSLWVRDSWVPRYLLVSLPGLAALVACGVAWLGRRARWAGVVTGLGLAAVLGAGLLVQLRELPQPSLRELATRLSAGLRPGDGVLVSPDRLVLPLGYYIDRRPARWLRVARPARQQASPAGRWLVVRYDDPDQQLEQRPAFRRWLQRHRRIWAVVVTDWPGDLHTPRLVAHLRLQRRQVGSWFFPYSGAYLLLLDQGQGKVGLEHNHAAD